MGFPRTAALRGWEIFLLIFPVVGDQSPVQPGLTALTAEGGKRRIVLHEAVPSSVRRAEEVPMDPIYLASVSDPATYVGWGWLSISIPNLIVILVMIVLFVLAIVLPFPKGRDKS